jgi:hypothetical protein
MSQRLEAVLIGYWAPSPMQSQRSHSSLQSWIWWVVGLLLKEMPNLDVTGLQPLPLGRVDLESNCLSSQLQDLKNLYPCKTIWGWDATCSHGLLLSFPRERISYTEHSRTVKWDSHSSAWSPECNEIAILLSGGWTPSWTLAFQLCGKCPDQENWIWVLIPPLLWTIVKSPCALVSYTCGLMAGQSARSQTIPFCIKLYSRFFSSL